MPIYRDYTQAELDAQYDQRTLVPDPSPYVDRWRAETAAARRALPVRLGVRYGDTAEEYLDIYGAGDGARPVIVFLHGGAWRQLSAAESGYAAPHFVSRGAIYVAVNFTLVPEVDLDTQVAQACRAVAWVREHAATFGGDTDRVHVCGHSSGGHLAAMAWSAGLATGAVAISGMYDLVPVRLSARNAYLHLDEAAARRNSPILYIPDRAAPLIVAWGERELDEFRRQPQAFAAACRVRGHACTALPLAGRNHFETGDDLARADSPLSTAVGSLLGLA